MNLLLYIIIFLSVLIVSNAMNKLFPSLPTPLVQILLGIGLRFLLPIGRFHLETEIFLALIIGPLLFREAEESDVTSILKHWKIVVYLIFPVIFLSTLSLGFLAHVLWAVLPLAACIVVGAALGPTDLVAFASLSERFTFPKRVENILKGEGLLNDASGLVAFQFALMAWMTGTFSIKQASFSLLISIIGGFIVGSFTAFLNRQLQKLLHTVRASDIAGELLLELSLPLLTFFLAEEIHVSGIIAVVVAGIFKASRFKRITLLEAQVNIVTDTIWQTVTFMLNGSVFVILGIELETIAEPILKNPVYDNFWLLLTILLLTIVLFAIRFVMISGFYFLRSLRLKKRMSNYWRDMALLTFSGVKGTVSIATILLIPTALEKKYPLLLFLVAGVTLLSFLTGLVVLPRLSENKEESSDYLMQIAILNDVVQELEKELKHTKVKAPLYAAIDNYHGRIEHLILEQEGKSVQKDLTDLQLLMLSIESDGLEQAYEERNISNRAYSIYQRYLWSMEQRINRNLASRLNYFLIVSFRIVRFLLHEVFTLGSTFRNWLNQDRINPSKTEKEEIADLYLANTEVIISSLENLKGVYNTALINFLQDSRISETAIIESGAFIERVITRIKPNNIKEMLRGYYLERKIIFEYEHEKLISASYAKYLRQNVNNLENYSLKETANTLPYDMMDCVKQK
ncbi:Sodium, potassium, lithium and rubidium/H(+) antiporter [Streptococcus intermedius]|uniref:cation:proton antiporter n=1 Tax=Streptococcus intermedius TaxID=1338 RepID=UPI000F65BB55|nr:sodium:proton antiporter [Streptococcus intermedius]RSJ09503.1 Sodium, potassium, lithium and rubidium/H(+) antiporter [Streptococcus intermedius]RSJ15473.1 Sodium, potassium, lithium and rubidium/H(+) antiporter [Streptococcus intermedius]RSJ29791.1 Sodium, potassium, lithium and rubidium/H(+) antiporter [Streptococcus intermedius]